MDSKYAPSGVWERLLPERKEVAMTTTHTGPVSGTLNSDGVLHCGCIVRVRAIKWCSLHAAVLEMLAILQVLVARHPKDCACLGGCNFQIARALLAKIEEKP